MQDTNEDIAHDNLEDEMDNMDNKINEATEGILGPLTPTHQKETLFLMKKVRHIHFDSSRIIDGVFWAMQVVGFACALCKSDMKTSVLLECCAHENIKPCRPIKVVKTCWNSHIAALDRHWDNRPAVVRLCSGAIYEHLKLEKYALRANEWPILEQIQPVLHVSYTEFSP